MHSENFMEAVGCVGNWLDFNSIEKIAKSLSKLKGRLFIIGVGGSAANASHAVNDMRKLCGVEAYAPTDNVSELTARANDDGFQHIFSDWLRVSKIGNNDILLVLSVGGGNAKKNVSLCIIEAVKLAKKAKAKVFGILGRSDGYTARHADIAIVIPTIEEKWITPLSEAFQMVIIHCLVSHPLLQKNKTKW